jgi:hypothetical protein
MNQTPTTEPTLSTMDRIEYLYHAIEDARVELANAVKQANALAAEEADRADCDSTYLVDLASLGSFLERTRAALQQRIAPSIRKRFAKVEEWDATLNAVLPL